MCVSGELSDRDKGMIRRASTGRNALSYDNPANPDIAFCQAALDLMSKVLAAGRGRSRNGRRRSRPRPSAAEAPDLSANLSARRVGLPRIPPDGYGLANRKRPVHLMCTYTRNRTVTDSYCVGRRFDSPSGL